MSDKFDQWELNKVCAFVARHNHRVFKSADEVKREIYSRATEIDKDGETMAICGFIIIRHKEDRFQVAIHSCILPDA